jgi:hypothetical protein
MLDLSTLSPQRPVSEIRIRRAMVPNVSWNIVTQNQVFVISFAPFAATYTITLPNGYYNRDELIFEVNTQIAAALVATTYSMVFNYNARTFQISITATDAGVPVAFRLDLPRDGTGKVEYKDYPNIYFMLGIDDVALVSLGTLITSATWSIHLGAVNSDPNRYAMITCAQANGLNGKINSFNYATGVITDVDPPVYAWQEGIVAIFPLELPKGKITDYAPEDDALWIPVVIDQHQLLTFSLSQGEYLRFGPSYVYWSILLEVR